MFSVTYYLCCSAQQDEDDGSYMPMASVTQTNLLYGMLPNEKNIVEGKDTNSGENIKVQEHDGKTIADETKKEGMDPVKGVLQGQGKSTSKKSSVQRTNDMSTDETSKHPTLCEEEVEHIYYNTRDSQVITYMEETEEAHIYDEFYENEGGCDPKQKDYVYVNETMEPQATTPYYSMIPAKKNVRGAENQKAVKLVTDDNKEHVYYELKDGRDKLDDSFYCNYTIVETDEAVYSNTAFDGSAIAPSTDAKHKEPGKN